MCMGVERRYTHQIALRRGWFEKLGLDLQKIMVKTVSYEKKCETMQVAV